MSDFDSGWVGSNPIANLAVTELAGGAITGVVDNSQQTIVTYTAGSNKSISLISVSGTVYAKFQLYRNATLIETRRGGPDRTLTFEWSKPLHLNTGDILDVKVIHYSIGTVAEFESTIYGG
jgi:hypothetical protein